MARHARFVRMITVAGLVAAMAGGARAEVGRDLLAGRPPVYALAEKGAAWQKELAFEKGGLVKVRARWTFDVPDPSAWAGAPLYGKAKDAEQQNPHSKAFARAHHFCLFTVTPEGCTLRVLTPEGEEIDTCRWSPRQR
ncbi:MAG: hypothetical protein ISS74_01335 [Planctomycetes bacterium]|nr:hypothetical protein [Planctomycetota bacterium]